MAVQLESAARLAALRDKADAVTGESSATLAGAVDALIAGFGSGGGSSGGSLESGEFTGTASTYWAFTIPVSSKKTHLLVLPKSFYTMWSKDNTSRERMIVAVEGIGHIQATPGTETTSTEVPNAVSRWYFADTDKNTVYFNDESIRVSLQYSPWASDDYLWFAW